MRVIQLCFLLALILLILTSVLAEQRLDGTTIQLNKVGELVDEMGYVRPEAMVRDNALIMRKYRRQASETSPTIGSLENRSPSHRKRHRKRAERGHADLTTYENAMWSGKITVAGQTLEVVFDTGSSDVLLPGTDCGSCEGHTRVTPRGPKRAQCILEYGDSSSAIGNVYAETVTIDGLDATDQAICIATTYSSRLHKQYFPPDGIVGMGFPALSVLKQSTFVQSLQRLGKISQAIFSFKMGSSRGRVPRGELTIGGINNALYKGHITYSRVTEQKWWKIALEALSVGDEQIPFTPADRTMQAIIDTGAHMISVDKDTATMFYSKVPGSRNAPPEYGPGHWIVPCDKPPSVGLTFGQTKFSIPPHLFYVGRLTNTANDCLGGLNVGDHDGAAVIGVIFLSNVYSIFNMAQGLVGFAELKENFT